MPWCTPGGQSKTRRGAVKGKLMHLHSLERAVLSQQQQLMQIQGQMQRVVLATNKARKDRQRKVNECTQHEEAEKRHHNDAIDLCERIEVTKARASSRVSRVSQCRRKLDIIHAPNLEHLLTSRTQNAGIVPILSSGTGSGRPSL